MKKCMLFLANLALGIWCGAEVRASAVECRWSEHSIVLDGKADEPAWMSAQWMENFKIPGINNNPGTKTRVAFLWNREALYFYAEMEDRDLSAELNAPDSPKLNKDTFEVFIQPRRSEPRYYEFAVDARNTRFSTLSARTAEMAVEVARRIDADKAAWSTVVAHQGTLNQRDDRDSGWSVEGHIPYSAFESIGGRPAPGAEWPFLAARHDYTNGQEPELSASTALEAKGGLHQPEAWQRLRFVGPPLEEFIPWTNTRLIGTPEPPPPYRAIRAYPLLTPHSPVAVNREPGTDRVVFLENYGYGELRGILKRFKADPNVTSTETLLELKEHVYSLTFHPRFAQNGFIFLGVNGPDSSGTNQTRIIRYTFEREAPYRVLPESRRVIIEWASNGHNGGDCAFGNDGMLYVTSGDGTSGSDPDDASQNLSNLCGKALRIDVDGTTPDRTYLVPADNPFISVAEARPEIWAYGLRNPWRITCDARSGQIWIGDNGQDLREMAYLLRRGANYGWSAYEGSRAFVLSRLRGPSPFTPPTVEHDHSTYRSLTGGIVYRGTAFPELVGAYIYGDHTTGRIGAAKHDGKELLWQRDLANTPLSIAGFGVDADNELLIADYGGGFYRLAPQSPKTDAAPFPKMLSETGLFTDTATQRPAKGVLPYQINVPGWHDGATGEHWLAVPAGARLQAADRTSWMVDNGMVAVQTLSLDAGNKPRRVETRVLLKEENDWTAYTYVWNEAQTDAELAPAAGRRIKVELPTGHRDWLVPGRSECLVCHSRAANFALTATTWQLNRPAGDSSQENQLQWLERHGLIRNGGSSPLLSAGPESLPRFPPLTDTNAPIASRARTYLAVNCAHCHTADGGGNSAMNMSAGLDLSEAHLLDEIPRHGTFRMKDARIIAPGAPSRSVLVTRAALRIPGQMPPLGTLRSDPDGVRLLAEWISSLRDSKK